MIGDDAANQHRGNVCSRYGPINACKLNSADGFDAMAPRPGVSKRQAEQVDF